MDLTEINTLKITFEDGTTTLLPKWFTDQFDYFKDIIEDMGVDKVNDDNIEYKYFEIDLRGGSELSRLLSKTVLAFLKRYAYHTSFVLGATAKEDKWHTTDTFQMGMIMKLMDAKEYNELFQIYSAANYLGYAPLCHAITDELIMKMEAKKFDMNVIASEFKIPMPTFNCDDQKNILRQYEWQY